MIRILKLNEIDREDILCRSIGSYPEFEKSVSEILAAVEKDGDAALYAYAARFDKVELDNLIVSEQEIAEAFSKVDSDYIEILNWMERTGRNYPIHIHSMNVVGVENMRRIIRKNGWKEM